MSIINAIKAWIKKGSYDKKLSKMPNPLIMSNMYTLIQCKKSKQFFCILNNNCLESTGKKKWNEIFHFNDTEWKNIFTLPFKITNSKLQWFQYRILSRILASNLFLFKIKVKDNKNCTFCGGEEETIEHLLWECDCVQIFLRDFESHLENKTNFQVSIKKNNFLFGFLDRKKTIQNKLILWLKYYIYTTRCKDKTLNVIAVISHLKTFYETQKYIAYRNGKKDHFDTCWNCWNQELEYLFI